MASQNNGGIPDWDPSFEEQQTHRRPPSGSGGGSEDPEVKYGGWFQYLVHQISQAPSRKEMNEQVDRMKAGLATTSDVENAQLRTRNWFLGGVIATIVTLVGITIAAARLLAPVVTKVLSE